MLSARTGQGRASAPHRPSCLSPEHVCSILASLLRNLRGQQRTRLLNKFTENDSEKVRPGGGAERDCLDLRPGLRWDQPHPCQEARLPHEPKDSRPVGRLCLPPSLCPSWCLPPPVALHHLGPSAPGCPTKR